MTSDLRKKLGEATTPGAITELLNQHSVAEFTARDVDAICDAIDRVGYEPIYRIAILSNYTCSPLDKYIRVESARLDIPISTYIGPYGQYAQEVLDPQSGLHAFKPEIVMLSLTLEQLSPTSVYRFAELSADERIETASAILDGIDSWVSAAKSSTDSILILCNFEPPSGSSLGIADSKESFSEREFYAKLNLGLAKRYRQDTRVNILDLNAVVSRFGLDRAYVPRMYYLAKMPWRPEFLASLAAEFIKYLVAASGRTAKCVAVDLDNTLWGGVVGEDGASNIRIGLGDPVSEAYLSFQYAIRALKERGVVLAICSKNNESDIDELFELRTDMPLKLTDFSAKQINWENKHENLVRIADDLNIGIDSLVFVDDNPVECAMVRDMLPEVRTVQLPPDPADYVAHIRKLPYFERLSITQEDRKKSDRYRDNIRRQQSKHEFGDLNAFLESLGTELEMFPTEPEHAKRTHQLFTKTNQFNATTKRYSPADIDTFLENPNFDLWLVNVRDRLGDLGIVGLCLLEQFRESVRIDSFILSCRAMGRNVETAIMNNIKQYYLLDGKFKFLDAEYIQTKKNMPASNFFPNQGFELQASSRSSGNIYRLPREKVSLLPCPGIESVLTRPP